MVGAGYRLINKSLVGLGHYRVLRVGEVAARRNDGLGQHHFLALGMRETLLQNIESLGLDKNGKPDDTGWIQINRYYNAEALKDMPAVAAGTWKPVVPGKTPFDRGYCPRFEEALQFTDERFAGIMRQAHEDGVAVADLPRFAIASHNEGYGNALDGYERGNVDLHTSGGDYSAWVLATAPRIKLWLALHPNWRP